VFNEFAFVRGFQAFIYFLRKPFFVAEKAINRFLYERFRRAALSLSHARELWFAGPG
jgi:hypothetical protein